MIANIGGAEGDRTPDLMTASHALSQLSYGPFNSRYLDRKCLTQSSLAFSTESSYRLISRDRVNPCGQ